MFSDGGVLRLAMVGGGVGAIEGRAPIKYGLERAIMDQEVLTAWKVSTRTQTPVSSRLVTAFRAFL